MINGSGKTTTLFSIFNQIKGLANIITQLGSIEYRMPWLNQVEVNNKIGLTLHQLADLLRSDPDVILVGEIRDNETLNCSSKRLIWNTTLSTIPRFHWHHSTTNWLGLPKFWISSALTAVLG